MTPITSDSRDTPPVEGQDVPKREEAIAAAKGKKRLQQGTDTR